MDHYHARSTLPIKIDNSDLWKAPIDAYHQGLIFTLIRILNKKKKKTNSPKQPHPLKLSTREYYLTQNAQLN